VQTSIAARQEGDNTSSRAETAEQDLSLEESKAEHQVAEHLESLDSDIVDQQAIQQAFKKSDPSSLLANVRHVQHELDEAKEHQNSISKGHLEEVKFKAVEWQD